MQRRWVGAENDSIASKGNGICKAGKASQRPGRAGK